MYKKARFSRRVVVVVFFYVSKPVAFFDVLVAVAVVVATAP